MNSTSVAIQASQSVVQTSAIQHAATQTVKQPAIQNPTSQCFILTQNKACQPHSATRTITPHYSTVQCKIHTRGREASRLGFIAYYKNEKTTLTEICWLYSIIHPVPSNFLSNLCPCKDRKACFLHTKWLCERSKASLPSFLSAIQDKQQDRGPQKHIKDSMNTLCCTQLRAADWNQNDN